MTLVDTTLEHARRLDAADALAPYRDAFAIPERDGRPVVYLCGNSLGLQPRRARTLVLEELDDWARLGVDAHFRGRTPWYGYHEVFTESGARLVGAEPGEVVMMNSLTVNLHLMMRTFFRPEGARRRILMERPAFPSDVYAIRTHLRTRGLDPAEDLIEVGPAGGAHVVDAAVIEEALERDGSTIALVILAGVNFLTGQVIEMARLAEAAHRAGCVIGLDLAHAAGNVPLSLHDWDADFAVWCSYKYLNAGPGAIAGCFVHARHARRTDLPRYGGWWGNDPDTRFRMHLEPEFIPRATAEGWQLSNPPILAMAPLRASLELFDGAGMNALREKSRRLTGYMRALIERAPAHAFEIITPSDPEAQGCQLSLLVHDRPRERFRALEEAGIVADFREPNVVRAAPVPLYNTFEDAWRFADVLGRVMRGAVD